MLLVCFLNGLVLFSVETQRGWAGCWNRSTEQRNRVEQRVGGPLEQTQAEKVGCQTCLVRLQQEKFNQNAVPPERPFMNEALARHFFQVFTRLQ